MLEFDSEMKNAMNISRKPSAQTSMSSKQFNHQSRLLFEKGTSKLFISSFECTWSEKNKLALQI